jgi:hypothetical protein
VRDVSSVEGENLGSKETDLTEVQKFLSTFESRENFNNSKTIHC